MFYYAASVKASEIKPGMFVDSQAGTIFEETPEEVLRITKDQGWVYVGFLHGVRRFKEYGNVKTFINY